MASKSQNSEGSQKHILTVSVEEYYHAGALKGSVRRKHWTRFQSRLERQIDDLLALLEPHGHHATFFVLGCIADRQPELVKRIAAHGHEIAASTYWPQTLAGMLHDEFREEVRRSRCAIEQLTGTGVLGFRTPREWLAEENLWVLDVLEEEGFRYDSSIKPALTKFARRPEFFRTGFHRKHGHAGIWEVPVSTVGALGLRLPVSGGNYTRQLPHTVLREAVAHLDRSSMSPIVFYLMPWEMDSEQPNVASLSRLERIRHYRNLGKTRWVFEDYFKQYRLESVGERLQLERSPVAARTVQTLPPSILTAPVITTPSATALPVSLVVPLFNEVENVGYLHRTLIDIRQQMADRYRVHVVLVDDGSRDGTWAAMGEQFAGFPDCELVQQPINQGVAAAVLAGVAHSKTDFVCSIDCDCSYDPYELASMIPLIEDADIVTASPYHPRGAVLNVPGWRLLLSKTLSMMYSSVLAGQIHTYTSCCRVYRKSAIEGLTIENGGFLGIAEILIYAKLRGARIVEHPATLESRLFGESKMKVLRTIRGHLGLLRRLIVRRMSAPSAQTVGAARGVSR